MKFWQLVSILRPHKQLLNEQATKCDEWRYIADWLAEYDFLVDSQDRSKLDYLLPNQFIREVLKYVDLPYYLTQDGKWLRSWRVSSNDKQITVLEAFERYGGNAIEEAVEFGSFQVSER